MDTFSPQTRLCCCPIGILTRFEKSGQSIQSSVNCVADLTSALLFTAQVNSWDANSMFKSSPLLEHLEYQKALPSITEAKAIAEAGSITTLIVGSATYPIVLRYLNALPSLKSLSVLNSNIPRYEFGHLSGPSMPCLPSVDRVVLGTPMDPGYYTQFRDVWPIDRLFPSMGSFCLYNANENKDPQQVGTWSRTFWLTSDCLL